MIQGNTFFKEQDAYQQRKILEMQATNLMLRQQLNQKEMKKDNDNVYIFQTDINERSF